MQEHFFSFSENDRKSFIENPLSLLESKAFCNAFEFYGMTPMSQMFISCDGEKIPTALHIRSIKQVKAIQELPEGLMDVLGFVGTLTRNFQRAG